MNEQWKTAALGGLGGALLSLAILFGAAATGILPIASDARLHDYLMAHPDIVFAMVNKAQSAQADTDENRRKAAIAKIGLKSYFSPSVAYVTGPANAKNTFVEFFDYNCAHCRNTFPVVQKFYNEHKNDTRFAFIDFPIFGEASTNAARAAVASRRQGDYYLALHFLLMKEDGPITTDVMYADAKKAGLDIYRLGADVRDPKVDGVIAAAHKLADETMVTGTPTFIINGKMHEGEISEAELNKLLKS